MKKTLLVTLDYYPNVGGIANYWKRLSDCLPAESFLVYVPKLSRIVFPRWLPLFFRVYSIIKKEKIEHVIVGQILPIGTVVWILSKVMQIRYSVSTHGMDIAPERLSSRKIFLCKKILAGAEFVICNSEYTASLVKRYGQIAHIEIVYPCPSIIPSDHATIQNQNHTLLTVARLVRRKGHEDVLRALTGLVKEFPDLSYVIIGDGPERQFLENLARQLQLDTRVRFVGHASDEEVAEWYTRTSVVIMTPTREGGDVEGFGITYLEANAFGKPVIASRTGGVGEAVVDGETGILVKPGDSQAIHDAIRCLLNDRVLAERLGNTGRMRVQQDFNWREQARKLEQALH
ncbi:glycosyltransferase family 4 protein [Candidatus Uhrbacteria bacterium]|nr:glycosyltransferase family 4 protein [Candidatus Uhrbacteria bacterium]